MVIEDILANILNYSKRTICSLVHFYMCMRFSQMFHSSCDDTNVPWKTMALQIIFSIICFSQGRNNHGDGQLFAVIVRDGQLSHHLTVLIGIIKY